MTEIARSFGAAHHPQRRQTARDLIEYDTTILRPGTPVKDVRLIDISPKGFHARSAGPVMERGEALEVMLPLLGPVPARTMWGLRGCFGAQFVVPIDARAYLDVLATARRLGTHG